MRQGLTAPLRILVVDDDLDTAKSFAVLLRQLGHESHFLTDPTLALAMARRMATQLVFLDIGMPDIDGWALARILRKEMGESVRIVALTAYGTSDDRKRSREAGFDAHLQKPIDIELLKSALAQISYGLR